MGGSSSRCCTIDVDPLHTAGFSSALAWACTPPPLDPGCHAGRCRYDSDCHCDPMHAAATTRRRGSAGQSAQRNGGESAPVEVHGLGVHNRFFARLLVRMRIVLQSSSSNTTWPACFSEPSPLTYS